MAARRFGAFRQVQAGESRLRVLRVLRAAVAGLVHQQERMVHRAAAGAELHRADVAVAAARHGQDEVPVDIAAVRRQHERIRHLEHKIRFTQFPSAVPSRHLRQVLFVAFAQAVLRPTPEHRDLRVPQPPVAHESMLSGLGQPRWHVAARRDIDDRFGPLPRVGVGDQGERCRLPGAVARCAVPVQQRRDIAGEGDRSRSRSSPDDAPDGGSKDPDESGDDAARHHDPLELHAGFHPRSLKLGEEPSSGKPGLAGSRRLVAGPRTR